MTFLDCVTILEKIKTKASGDIKNTVNTRATRNNTMFTPSKYFMLGLGCHAKNSCNLLKYSPLFNSVQ